MADSKGDHWSQRGPLKMYVCAKCVEYAGLQEVVQNNLISKECDYCGRKSRKPIACEISDVIERISWAIQQEYGSPEEETMYDPEEGDYAGDVLYHTDVFDEIGFDLANEDLRDEIVDSFSDERFCRIGMWSGSPSERMNDAWDGFKAIIKHRRRYTFWTIPDDECDHGIGEHHPREMLDHIGETITWFELSTVVVAGAGYWRIRVHDKSKPVATPDGLAAPSPEQAKYSNRMSPAGVAMFYGAEDFDTACEETIDPSDTKGKMLTGGLFRTTKPLLLLDLCNLPKSVCFFNDWDSTKRFGLYFLKNFQNDLSRPIQKDGRQHIEYVPTQVFTEFIRFQFKTSEGDEYMGIRYPSSKTGKPCVALFVDQEQCLPPRNQWAPEQLLELDLATINTIDDLGPWGHEVKPGS